MNPIAIDTLIGARWVVPVEPAASVLHQHSVAISGGKIVALLPSDEAQARFIPAQRIELRDHVLIPGLINLHTHAAMSLMRGLADDMPLMAWLEKHIWPVEAKHVSPQFVYDGTLLACAEMLRGGVTCFNDMYFFPEAAARAALTARMRAVLGIIVLEFPSAYAGDAEDYLHRGLATRDEMRDEALLKFSFAPHAPYTVSDKTFERVATYAQQLDLTVHIHLHETEDEITQSLAQHQLRPLARLANLGLLGPNFIAVHAVHLSCEEIRMLQRQGCHVAHCPTSNLKLSSGFAPVAALLEAGVNVGIGSDGAASNNRLDVLGDMRLAALLAKAVAGRPDAVSAHTALQMATINSARALGWEREIGSLLPGKAADIVALDLSGPECLPCYDVVAHLAYSAERSQVTHVWVNGELLVENRRPIYIDSGALSLAADGWRERMQRGS